jgi:hypothetical protein
MAKKQGNLKVVGEKKRKQTLKKEDAELDHLPAQSFDSVALYETDVKVIEGIIGADDFREGLVKLKAKFIMEIQEWSKRFGVETDLRVYFTVKEPKN